MQNTDITTIVMTAAFTAVFGYIANILLECRKFEMQQKAFLVSIRHELLVFKGVEITKIGTYLSRLVDGQQRIVPFLYYDRFPVFSSVIKRIGIIRDDTLIEKIISCYSQILSLTCSLKIMDFCVGRPAQELEVYVNVQKKILQQISESIDDVILRIDSVVKK